MAAGQGCTCCVVCRGVALRGTQGLKCSQCSTPKFGLPSAGLHQPGGRSPFYSLFSQRPCPGGPANGPRAMVGHSALWTGIRFAEGVPKEKMFVGHKILTLWTCPGAGHSL